ncbi:MAG: hypothetical protein OHK0012_00190 [Synechococcales cyanobacterium]
MTAATAAVSCPLCQRPLQLFSHPEVSAGVCRGGCGGLLVQGLVFKKLFQSPPSLLNELSQVPRDPAIQFDRRTKLNCPCCRGTRMMQRFYSQEKKAIIHECPRCARVWFNGGELTLAMAEHEGKKQRLHQAETRSAAVQTYLEQKQRRMEQLSPLQRLFPRLTGAKVDGENNLERYLEDLKRNTKP